MTAPSSAPRQLYLEWVEDQIEDYKATLTRDELLDIAEVAVQRLGSDPAGQYSLTELLLCDAVDALLFEKLGLPDYKHWLRTCRNDTEPRPPRGTTAEYRAAS
jgi:hypothetical protein